MRLLVTLVLMLSAIAVSAQSTIRWKNPIADETSLEPVGKSGKSFKIVCSNATIMKKVMDRYSTIITKEVQEWKKDDRRKEYYMEYTFYIPRSDSEGKHDYLLEVVEWFKSL